MVVIYLYLLLVLSLPPLQVAYGPAEDGQKGSGGGKGGATDNTNDMKLKITAGSTVFYAALADNPAAAALRELLPFTVSMDDLNSNEKYCYLPADLPTGAQRYETISNGDVMLYGADCLVLFYKTFSSGYSYTRLGRVENPEGLQATLGAGKVTVTWEIGPGDRPLRVEKTGQVAEE